jgi:succinate-acetate transporter protein
VDKLVTDFSLSKFLFLVNSANSAAMARPNSIDDINTEKGYPSSDRLERLRTQGGHIARTDQPSLPVVHRRLANPAPLGLLSFATGIFLISILGVHARGIQTPNVLVGVLMFFGGVCQFIAGIMEFVAGNTFGATVFPSYAAFNFSYAMIFIPGTGIVLCKFNIP